MTRQMAGAYVGPMLDLLDSLVNTTEAQGKLLMRLVEERAETQRHAGDLIVQAEALQALPDWMIQGAKRVIGGQHGA